MKRRVAIFIACWFFAGGIVLASFLPKDWLFFGLYYFSAAIIFSTIAVVCWKKKNTRAILIWAAFLFLGIWRFSISLPIDSPNNIWHYNGQKRELIGLVSSEPATKGKSQKLEVFPLLLKEGVGVVIDRQADSIATTSQNHPQTPPSEGGGILEKEGLGVVRGEVAGKVLVIAAAYPQYDYGDVLKISCTLKRPDKLDDFDYEKYLAGKGIYSTCNFPKIEILSDKNLSPPLLAKKKSLTRFSWLWGGIYQIRKKLSGTIDNGLAEPEAGLLKAFILNDPTVPDDLSDIFRQSGLSHIVAISGTHISLVIAIIFFCLLFLGLNRRHAFWFCVPIILLYVVMVGAPASATRAGIMGFLVLLAMYLGRLARLDYTLALAGAGMLLFNPMLVIADAGFQLSFLAVLGMIYLYPIFDKWLSRFYEIKNVTHPAKRGAWHPSREGILKIICQTAALTIAAQVFTAPILIFGFHQISLVAPIANLFALWAAPFIMITAFIAMGLTLIFPAGAIYFFLPADILVKYLIAVAQISASLPFAYWKF
ncbi:MAG: ComEC/Rec2 family competence protein [Patescibacteria group bacterium]|nr:ComEC/Rec2 family competence protein [Patescibacteria group bacterium]